MNRHLTTLLAAALAAALAPAAMAGKPANAVDVLADPALTQSLKSAQNALRVERAHYPSYFRQAYARYPSIPAGTLESMAYVASRWQHLRPAASDAAGNREMPRAYGVMGLYHGEGFADQVGEAARLLGVPESRILNDASSNILAAAALLDREIGRAGGKAGDAEALRPALQRYAGYAQTQAKSAVQDYARLSFAFDVLLTLDRGVNESGIAVPERAVAWERAFDAPDLVRLRAPLLRLNADEDRIETDHYFVDPETQTLQSKDASKAAAAAAAVDYAPARWVASPYHSDRTSYDSATIHTVQGSYAGSISWFQNNPDHVSIHYLVRSSDGQITQMVRENRAAHHVLSHNKTTLGIEHEGYVDNASWYTTAMYNASAGIVRHFCAKYSAIKCNTAFQGPATRTVKVLPASVKVKGHQHYSGNDHTDPGINWDWSRYYKLLNPGGGNGGVTGTVATSGTPLNVRSGPGTNHNVVGTLADGASVTIQCQTNGTSVTGTYGTSTLWNRIGTGRFIPDVYTFTGSDGRVAPDC
ncbi:N-acetylmuramoyl-L-alanine amidase [Pseudomonas sp. CGJS7]|uniref:N-acetylmuramoyl-L-alanine amidase n=1 Tax=Pseudomonas sp. CGJS7 TaxID=3109348 RepID=UPI003008E415